MPCRVVMGSGQKILSRVGSIFCGSGRVSHLWFGFEFQKFPLKMSNFSIFFPSGQKKLLRVRSESTRVEARSESTRVSLLFTAGQKEARVGSGPISTAGLWRGNMLWGGWVRLG